MFYKKSLFINPFEYGKFNNNDDYCKTKIMIEKGFNNNSKDFGVLNIPITYGSHSSLFNNVLIKSLLNSNPIYIYNMYNELPIVNTSEVFRVIEELLLNKTKGKYCLEYNEKRKIKDIIEIIEKSVGKKFNYNTLIVNLLKPADSNIINEHFYCQEFMNCMKLINEGNYDDFNKVSELELESIGLKNKYSKLKENYEGFPDLSMYTPKKKNMLEKVLQN